MPRTDPTPGYLALVLTDLARAMSFPADHVPAPPVHSAVKMPADAPQGHGNAPMEFPTQW